MFASLLAYAAKLTLTQRRLELRSCYLRFDYDLSHDVGKRVESTPALTGLITCSAAGQNDVRHNASAEIGISIVVSPTEGNIGHVWSYSLLTTLWQDPKLSDPRLMETVLS